MKSEERLIWPWDQYQPHDRRVTAYCLLALAYFSHSIIIELWQAMIAHIAW